MKEKDVGIYAHVEDETFAQLEKALSALRGNAPSERGELARRYAVTITEMEKVCAYFKVYAVEYFNR